MKYTQDQISALETMVPWVNSPITDPLDYLYTLDGAAGTGKTTVTKEFIRRIGILPSKIAVTAPTHKAKKVIKNATGYNAETIQKLLGLRPDVQMDKFDINSPAFKPIGKSTLRHYKIILIDESSMLNNAAFQLLHKEAVKHKIRIVFLGDAYQLPPVGEKISKVFSTVKHISTLTTVVRQGNDNPMSEILQMLREDIKNGTDKGIKTLLERGSNVLHDKGFKCLPLKSTSTQVSFGSELLMYYYSSEYDVMPDYMKFITYTNESVETWSEAIRQQLLKGDYKNQINVGESLTGYGSITEDKTTKLIIENSEDYTITKITRGRSSFDIDGFYTTLVNSDGDSSTVFIVDRVDINNFKRTCIEKLDLAQARKGFYWKKFFEFKQSHLLLDTLYRDESKPKNSFGNLLCKKDLYYSYGVTVHKSQGSSYENAAINLQDLYKSYDQGERARLIYVALSRTKNMNLLLVK